MHHPRCLPQEIIDMIVDYFHDDKRSLVACSVVSSTWLPAARHHLFYTHRLDARRDGTGYAGAVSSFLEDPRHFHVRELVLSPGASPHPSSELQSDALRSLVTRSPQLHSLQLRQTGFNSPPWPEQPTDRLSLNRLSVNWGTMTTPSNSCSFVELLSSFSFIRELDVVAVVDKYLPLDLVDPLQTEDIVPTRVIALNLQTLSPLLLRAVRFAINPDCLDHIRACISAPSDVIRLGEFLLHISQNITQFQLSIWNFWTSDEAGELHFTRTRPFHSLVLVKTGGF